MKQWYRVPLLLKGELMLRKSNYILKDNWAKHVGVDGRLITGQNPQSAAAVGDELVKMLKHYNY